MAWLEEKIRPPRAAPPRVRDLLGLGLLAALAVALLPALRLNVSLLASALAGTEGAREQVTEVVTRHTSEIAAWYVLPALGFALALRRGAVDLSVWAAAGLGGLVAAAVLQADWGPGWALAAALGAGLVVGALNGLLVAGARVPSIVATLVTGFGLVWVSQACISPGGEPGALPQDAFDGWRLTKSVVSETPPEGHPASAPAQHPPGEATHAEGATQEVWLPLRVTRMMVVGVIFSLAVLVLLILMANDVGRPDSMVQGKLFAALCASGTLAAAGGMCWLIDHPGSPPVPSRLVDDLRIPAAAILAGAAFLGRRRTAIIAMCLPFAAVLVTAWRQEVWDLAAWGYAWQVAVLAGMVLLVHIGFAHVCGPSARPRWLASAAATLIAAGLLVVAATVHSETDTRRRLFQHVGLGIWLGGAVLLLVSRVLSRRKAAAEPAAGGSARQAPPAE